MSVQRIFLISGITDLLTCAIAQRFSGAPPKSGENVFILCGNLISLPEHLRQETISISRRVCNWGETIDCADIFLPKGTENRSSLSIQRALASKFDTGSIQTIYCNFSSGKLDREIVDAFPHSKVMLYDNGLFTHLPAPVIRGGAQPLPASHFYFGHHIERMERAFFTLGDILPIPPQFKRVEIDVPKVEDIMPVLKQWKADMAGTGIDDLLSKLTGEAHLILGTSFSRLNLLSAEEEEAAYSDLVRALKNSEETNILFKAHPRARAVCSSQLSKTIQIDSVVPAELIPLWVPLKGAYSISSTSLLTLKKLYGIGGFTIGEEFCINENLAHVDMLYNFVKPFEPPVGATVPQRNGEGNAQMDAESLQLKHLARSKFHFRDDIADILAPNGVGIELGVAEGLFSQRILERCELSHLYGVDMYAGDRGHDLDQYKRAISRLMPYRGRSTLIKMRFDEALDLFPDEHFDFIYVDGYAHTGEEDGATIYQWYTKVKPGGVFGGDDYCKEWPLVVHHVDKLVERYGLKLFVINCSEYESYSRYPTWFIIKPGIASKAEESTSPEPGLGSAAETSGSTAGQEWQRRERRLHMLEKKLSVAESKRFRLEAALDRIHRSSSWQVTTPLRACAAFLRRVLSR